MDLLLDKKRVLISGSTSGIGLGIAEAFLKEGALVCITGRNGDKLSYEARRLQEQYGKNNILPFCGDLTNCERISELSEQITKEWGELDILIPNLGNGKPLDSDYFSIVEWKRMIDINLLSGVELVGAFSPLLKGEDSVITFISSIVAYEVLGTSIAYAAAKESVLIFSKFLSKKLAPHIRANVVVPGNVLFTGGRWEELMNKDPLGVEKMINDMVPMKRFAKPEDIANAVVFLSSPKASFITGATLVVDGGQINSFV